MSKVLLKVTHTHAGAVYQAGSVIDVDEHTARWIIDRQIGELLNEAKQSADAVKDKKAVSKKGQE